MVPKVFEPLKFYCMTEKVYEKPSRLPLFALLLLGANFGHSPLCACRFLLISIIKVAYLVFQYGSFPCNLFLLSVAFELLEKNAKHKGNADIFCIV